MPNHHPSRKEYYKQLATVIDFYKSLFFPSVIRLWNAPPPFIIHSSTLHCKNKVVNVTTNVCHNTHYFCVVTFFKFLHSNKYNNNINNNSVFRQNNSYLSEVLLYT